MKDDDQERKRKQQRIFHISMQSIELKELRVHVVQFYWYRELTELHYVAILGLCSLPRRSADGISSEAVHKLFGP